MKSVLTLLGTLLGTMFALSSCTAMLTAPVTMPIWIVLGCVFLIRPMTQLAWRSFTLLSLLQSLLTALFGFFAWYDLWQRGTWDAIQVRDTFFLFLFPAIATIGIIIAMILARAKLDSKSRRSLILLIDVLAAAFTIGPVLYMMTRY
jgi:hypothetical protein